MSVRRAFSWSVPIGGLVTVLACAGAAVHSSSSRPVPAPAQRTQLIDDFESLAAWRAIPAEGVRLGLRPDHGIGGQSMRLDVDVSRGGYAIARRELDLRLPENYEFTFWLRGELPPNTLEFKLVDASGENVWWHVQRDVQWPADWQRVRIRARQISFAWGPQGGGDLRHAAALEIAITAGTGGGSGSVWLDSLSITALEPVVPYDAIPVASASDSADGGPPAAVLDGDPTTSWRTNTRSPSWIEIDFQRMREYGGISVSWDSLRRAHSYQVETSIDGAAWETVHAVSGAAGSRDLIPLPETESRWLRLVLGETAESVTLRDIDVHPLDWASSRNAFLHSVAKSARRGAWPRYLVDEQQYWTVVGPPGGRDEALVSEDGALEPRRAGPIVEPFLHTGDRLLGWSDVQTRHSLAGGSLPIPTVHWSAGHLGLEVTAVADTGGAPWLHARYRVLNRSDRERRATLYLAVRPVQANPSWQFLGTEGGAAPIHELAIGDSAVQVNGEVFLRLAAPPHHAGAMGFHAGSLVDLLAAGAVPERLAVRDELGYASGVVAYELTLPPGSSRDVHTSMPLSAAAAGAAVSPGRETFDARWRAGVERWERETGFVRIGLPAEGAELARALRSTLAYILINRDSAAIQPGTRSYRRSWIRDGSLTSAALLRLGRADVVRDYIDWYAPFQYGNGKVPCCVDHRGADPVPEHDSHGQLVWLIAEYVRFTGDTALARRHWPRVLAAITHMDSLRASRMTAPYMSGDSTDYRGLLPQSISHEGYSEKPMHSFWDDIFGLRGYKDAAWLASLVGDAGAARAIAAQEEAFRRDIVRAYEATMRRHGIDWLAGAVELGDFDATSTTVAVSPLNEPHRLPQRALERTFERYLENFRNRRDGREEWEAYTPYEWRSVGTFVRLGQPHAAHEIASWFMGHRRPAAWNHWAEVVWQDERAPRFIGDMPHGWVGSDFIRSVLDMLAYEREADSALVIGAAVPMRWATADAGVQVGQLRTAWGALDLRISGTSSAVDVQVGGPLRLPPGGIVVHAPMDCEPRSAEAAGRHVVLADGTARLRKLPARVRFFCAADRRPAVR